MVEALGFFLCQAQHFASPLGKLIESVSVVHLMYPPFQGLGWNRAPPSQVNLVLIIRHPRLSVKEAHPYKSAIQAVLRVLVSTRQTAGSCMVARTFGVLWRPHQSERRRAATGVTVVFRPGFRAMEAPVAHSAPCHRKSPYLRRSTASHPPRLVSSCASTLVSLIAIRAPYSATAQRCSRSRRDPLPHTRSR